NFSYITDLGLSVPANPTSSSSSDKNSVFGVLPYVAPEVLTGESYTTASDIYSFGILMTLISTGQQPFNNLAHDVDLAMKICKGVRPGFSKNTPKIFIELTYKCVDASPDRRPSAEEICEVLEFWKNSFNDQLINDPENSYDNRFYK